MEVRQPVEAKAETLLRERAVEVEQRVRVLAQRRAEAKGATVPQDDVDGVGDRAHGLILPVVIACLLEVG